MIGRTVEEWIGKTPDSKVPDRVKLRIWEREGGRCHLSGRKILAGEPWDLDHIIALCNGGEHRETNLAPALRDKHREKTARDVAERAKVDRIRKRNTGIKSAKGRPMPGSRRSPWKQKLTGEWVKR